MTTNVVNFGTEYENYDYDGVLIERLATVEWILINEKRSVQMQFDTISALPILLPPPHFSPVPVPAFTSAASML